MMLLSLGLCVRMVVLLLMMSKQCTGGTSSECSTSRLLFYLSTGVSQFDFYNVLEDQDFKEAVKQHS